jgi:magnesium transporter
MAELRVIWLPPVPEESALQVERGGLELLPCWRERGGSLWLDIEGELGDAERELIGQFGVSELSLADATRRRHPPKIEAFGNYTFVLFRGIASLGEDLDLAPQQLALFLGDNWMITAHRGTAVSVNHTWSQLESLWEGGLDLLTLKILHTIAGRYLDAVLAFEDRLGDFETRLLGGDAEQAMRELAAVRSRLRVLRRVFSYHERVAGAILAGDYAQLGRGVGPDSEHYHERRDLHDRCERLLSLCSMYYEICGDLIESYISISSHQLNQTMKVLTIITAVFVPLSFLAGVYGMNFGYMPELSFRYGYFVVLGVMATLVVVMLALFRRSRWL